jgi:hypothetical protein
MKLTIGTWSKEVASFAEASAAYQQRRGFGPSMKRLRDGEVLGEAGPLARVSHNGCVWSPGEWQPGDKPLYDPRTTDPRDPRPDHEMVGRAEIFRNHNCYRCKDGALPCVRGKPHSLNCDYPHARND